MDTDATVYERDVFENAVYIFKYWVSLHSEPKVEFVETPSSFTIKPLIENSFEVTIQRLEDGELIVYTHEWHCHPEDAVEAASLAFWLLTPFSRIVYETKSGRPWASWIENYRLDKWDAADYIFFADPRLDESWTAKDGEIFVSHIVQQDVLRWTTPITETCPGIVLDSSGLPPESFIGNKVEELAETRAVRVASQTFSKG